MAQNILYGEDLAPLSTTYNVSFSAPISTPRVAIGLYQRIVVLLFPYLTGTTMDVTVYAATAAVGGTSVALKAITQLGPSADSALPIIIDLMNEAFANPNAGVGRNYDYVYVTVTPSGTCGIVACVLGADARSLPTAQTLWTEALHVP